MPMNVLPYGINITFPFGNRTPPDAWVIGIKADDENTFVVGL